MAHLYILSGPSGAGKTTYIHANKGPEARIVCADDFFGRGGRYNFDPARLREAHARAHQRARWLIENGRTEVWVDATNTTAAEIRHYVVWRGDHEVRLVRLVDPRWYCPATGEAAMHSDSKALAARSPHAVPRPTVLCQTQRCVDHSANVDAYIATVGGTVRTINIKWW